MLLKNIQGIGLFFVVMATVSITNAQKSDFKTDAATGVQYHFIKHDKKGITAIGNDYARIVMLWTGTNAKGDADSIYLDTHKRGGDSIGALIIPLKKSFHGCLEEGIMMMTKGDSAAFRINADSLFIKTFHAPVTRIPHYINGNSMFTFNIKLVSFETNDEMMADRDAQMKKRMEKEEARKAQESVVINNYLQKNYPAAKPDADSIFYLQTAKGNGPQVQEGDSVEIKYRGTFLDGTSFDPQPGSGKEQSSFKIVYSKNMGLIQGWISILGKMNQGDKVRVLIPSKMAYGARAMGPIQAYTPLIFDMELVSVKSNK